MHAEQGQIAHPNGYVLDYLVSTPGELSSPYLHVFFHGMSRIKSQNPRCSRLAKMPSGHSDQFVSSSRTRSIATPRTLPAGGSSSVRTTSCQRSTDSLRSYSLSTG